MSCTLTRAFLNAPRRAVFTLYLAASQCSACVIRQITVNRISSKSRTLSSVSTSGEATSPPQISNQDVVLCQQRVLDALNDERLAPTLATSLRLADEPTGQDLVDVCKNAQKIVQLVKMEAISYFGFSANASGLLQYEMQLAERRLACTEVSLELARLDSEIWKCVLGKAFSTPVYRTLTLAEAREITARLQRASQDSRFLFGVRASLLKAERKMSVAERHAAVLNVVVPRHMEVLSEFGFDGPSGFVACHAALLQHVVDAKVAEQMMAASKPLLDLVNLGTNDSRRNTKTSQQEHVCS